ncbi:MAG: C25 family cysteine peptidase, partial [Candidatus Aegiribacteria sp.]
MYTLFLLTSLVLAPFPGTTSSPPPSAVEVDDTETLITWECPDAEPLSYLPRGLTGYTAEGCGWAGEDGSVLLPARDMMVAVPPGAEVRLEVIPEGVGPLGPATVSRAEVSAQGIDVFTAAQMEDVPSSWGLILESGSFRRAGFARIRLHPVIMRDGVLVSADRLRVRLSYPSDGRPSPSAGRSGYVFSALFQGGDRVWEAPARSLQESPFWGLPWYSLELDTAGIYSVEWSDVPQADGAPSPSLALFCGRGREMGDQPWENAYSPRAVPILVDDGGDGTFDQGDRLYFFGRGLAWWEPSELEMPDHFNHRYDDRNTYWLTWGGEDGARMDVHNGELTGAPAMPDSFLSRYHLEQNLERVRGTVSFSDDWAWLRSSGSADSWHYFDFDAPGALSTGYARMSLASTNIKDHRIRIFLNNELMCDTSWYSTTPFMLQFELDGIQDGENSLSLQVLRGSGSDVIYMDWFEIFPWTSSSAAGQVQVPLEWWPVFDRRSFTREAGLEDAMVFLVGGDTLAASVTLDDPDTFEFQVPESWLSRELWIADAGAVLSPAAVTYESPGRIRGTIDGAECLYVAADQFAETVAPLGQRGGAEVLSASEVYQEFNGGVRDPGAIRAMVSFALDGWDPIPTDLVLVGGGNWDPRNFITSRTSYIDILYRSTHVVSDDQFAIVQDLNIPQMAVSRIGVNNASDLQMAVSRSADYRDVESPGSWQTVVLGAADDERSPLHNNDERYHTQDVERLLTERLPGVLRPEKFYLIFYDWNSAWSKPEARTDYIEAWSRGALISFYLGHGSYDQLADEGLFYLEDNGLLSCGPRLPVAIFGSCEVGQFQNPSTDCIAQQVTTSPVGGAILGLGATGMTGGPANATMVGAIFDRLFSHSDLSVGMCVMLGKIDAGYGSNNSMYALFGDGSLPLAFPWETFDIAADTLLAGEVNTVSGTAPSEGLLLVESWESCLPDTYYTFRQSLPIGYLT